ncbi:MAG: NADH-quinone oxidoreductase subunit L [Phycisphaeraceae bacterium]|nr:NADH-quinone oxidoreductase subunit L [Phycisphaeraceae bacterium]
MTEHLNTISALLLGAIGAPADPPAFAGDALSEVPRGAGLMVFVPLLALASCALCGLCAAARVRTRLPAWITVACLAAAFGLTLLTYLDIGTAPRIAHAWDWITFQYGPAAAQTFVANFSFYIDSLTLLWMLFVTGLATLIALYASEYMGHDVGQGYNRFYAAFSLFVFSMACLVMGDNLLLLFLGWEGVGLCSYLLIGYFYKKPSAVAAAKKAFIMNRIGDLGLSLGVMLTFVYFGTIEYSKLLGAPGHGLDGAASTYLALAQKGEFERIPFLVQLIPVLLMIGAFGKSAQVFLYVWLPDAMEGPTPVSALIHAATMVTAGVYLVARCFPLFLCSEWALPMVAWGGAITAFWAATIGMAQFDIKRIMAYSTVSQLGYMFAGLGVLGAVGGASHVFTHAFFKALLFLSCGAVMHGFAGQLDLRKLSGVGKMPGWRIVGIAMLVGCLNLAGFPLITAGFYSKDMILADAFANTHLQAIGWLLLLTAGMTAYYTFRVFFRVFVGPQHFEPGDEVHGHDDAHHGAHAEHEAEAGHGHDGEEHGQDVHATHDFHPHPPGIAINFVLAALAVLSIAAVGTFFVHKGHHGWAGMMVHASTAGVSPGAHEHAHPFGMDAHTFAMIASSIVGVVGIVMAFWLHFVGRTTAAKSRADSINLGALTRGAQNKWYVDEIYDWLFVKPLWVLSHVLHAIDKVLVDGLVNVFGWAPRGVGGAARNSQTGVLHDYAVRMAGGAALVIALVLIIREVRP